MSLLENADDARGQVGIGTLIVFIAMVLVAAVAAGVLINTGDQLQQSAQSSGDEAESGVTNQVEIVSASGEVTDTGNTENITKLTFVVKKSAGSDKIDLEDATITFQSGDKRETLTYAGSTSSTEFAVSEVTGDGDNVLDNSSERLEISVSLTDLSAKMTEGDDATVEIVSASGAETLYEVNAPQTMSGEDYVRV